MSETITFTNRGYETDDVAETLRAGSHGAIPMVAHNKGTAGVSGVYALDHVITTGGNCTAQGPCYYEELAPTLKAAGPHAIGYQEQAGKPGGGKGILIQQERTGALSTLNNQSVLCLNDQGGAVMDFSVEMTGTLRAQDHGHPPLVLNGPGADLYNGELTGDTAVTLTAAAGGTNTSGPKVVTAGFKPRQGAAAGNIGYQEELAPTIQTDENYAVVCKEPQTYVYDARGNGDGTTVNTTQDGLTVCYGLDRASFNQGQNALYDPGILEEQQPTLTARGPGAVCGSAWDGSDVSSTLTANNAGGNQRMPDKANFTCVVQPHSVVRRLTPLECERLQGVPDGWTNLGEWTDSQGKRHKDADSPRYKALGNGIATPAWYWLWKRMSREFDRPPTLGSLFDGIGTFPMIHEAINGKGTARWSSEIEEFPIAVARQRIGDEDAGIEGDGYEASVAKLKEFP